MNTKRVFHKLIMILISLVLSLGNCQGKSLVFFSKKDFPELYKSSFSMKDFPFLEQSVENYHVHSEPLSKESSYAHAIFFASQNLSVPTYFLSESFYRGNKDKIPFLKDSEIIKLKPEDPFVIIPLDNSKLQTNPKTLEDYLAFLNKYHFPILHDLDSLKFTRYDMERVLDYFYKSIISKQNPNQKIGAETLILSAANGFLNSYDPYSKVFLRTDWDQSFEKTNPNIAGIGLEVEGGYYSDVVVTEVTENSPAEKVGIKSGDLLIMVDQKSIRHLSSRDISTILRGPKNSKVQISIFRYGEIQQMNFTLNRTYFDSKQISGSFIDSENIGYIKIQKFEKDSSSEIVKVFNEIKKESQQKKKNLKGLILDLRFNKGGLLQDITDSLDLFLNGKILFYIQQKGKGNIDFFAKTNKITDLPMAVLVNSGTSSGAEVFAGSLQSNKRAIIIGDRTFGNGTVQEIINFESNPNYLLKLTTGLYFLPNGFSPQLVGIRPDIMISSESDESFLDSFREENLWNHIPKQTQKGNAISNWNTTEIEQRAKPSQLQIKDLLLKRSIPMFQAYIEYINNL